MNLTLTDGIMLELGRFIAGLAILSAFFTVIFLVVCIEEWQRQRRRRKR